MVANGISRSRCFTTGLLLASRQHIPNQAYRYGRKTKMIRYKKLGYVELNVSDLEKSHKFYEDIVGLEFVGKRSDGAVMFRCDDEDSRSVILHQNQPAGSKSVGWQLENGSQFELLHRRFARPVCHMKSLAPRSAISARRHG